MFTQITEMLPADIARGISEQISSMNWESGAKSAAAGINRKNNEQLSIQNPSAQPYLKQIGQTVMNHAEVKTFAEPHILSRIFFGRYGEGMFYGSHNDAPITSGGGFGKGRADVSFTIFLSEPDSYEGGELVLESPFGEVRVKGEAGSAVMYDTGLMHRVEPITGGSRVVTVGWLQSWIQDPQERAILRDLKSAIFEAASRDNDSEETIRLRRIHANLMRRWAG